MDIDLDLAVSMNWASFKRESKGSFEGDIDIGIAIDVDTAFSKFCFFVGGSFKRKFYGSFPDDMRQA